MSDAPFELPEELEEFRGVVRQIAEERIGLARAAEIDDEDEFPWDVHKVFVENDLMAVGYPEEFGGAGGGSLTVAVMIEEISRISAGCALIPLCQPARRDPGHAGGQRGLNAGSCSARSPAATTRCPTASPSPGSGSDAVSMKTQYVPHGDGFRLSGTKRFITGAGTSNAYTVFATRDPAERAKGISAFLVYKDDAGVSFGAKEKKLGIHGSPTAEVYLDNVEVAADRLIGDEGEGFTFAMQTLDYSRPTIAAQALGIAQGAFDVAAPYATTREQFGKPIAELEGIQFMLADMAMEVEAARGLVYRAASMVDAGNPRMTLLAGDGQGVRVRRGHAGHHRRRPGARRLRLHARVPRRADDARREDHPDLRGHQSDPAGRHRPPDPEGHRRDRVTDASARTDAPRPPSASEVVLVRQMELTDANLLGNVHGGSP